MTITLWTCRAVFSTQARVRFPAVAGNSFRGALGFRVEPEVFAPRAAEGPSGLRDRPRPFVVRAAHLDGRSFSAGERVEARINVFSREVLPRIRAAFAAPRRRDEAAGLLDALRLEEWSEERVELDLRPRSAPGRIRLWLRTPLEMKGWDGAGLPPFPVLIARLRDRLSALAAFYGEAPLELDVKGLVERARAVEAVDGQLEQRRERRRSWRTGQTHALEGATGWVEYRGSLGEFVPLLEAGQWTGVGRHTVWGQGWIEIAEPGAPSISTLPPRGA